MLYPSSYIILAAKVYTPYSVEQLLQKRKNTMKKNIVIWSLLLLLGSSFALAGCEKKGPMEEMGESADNAVKKMEKSAKDIGK